MKVLLPSNTTHDITIEPRYFTTSTISLEIYNESNRDVTTQDITYTVNGGVMIATFDLNVLEGDKFTFKMMEDGNVIYRCKAFGTEQDPQEYKLTKDKYKYPNV
jgi:hypothetical protein